MWEARYTISPPQQSRLGVRRTVQSRIDGVENRAYLAQDIAVPEAQNAIAFAFKEVVATLIRRPVRVPAMLLTIHLDDEACAEASEVGDAGTDRHLPAKMCARRFNILQARPQLRFGRCHLRSQPAGPRALQDAETPFIAHELTAICHPPLEGEGRPAGPGWGGAKSAEEEAVTPSRRPSLSLEPATSPLKGEEGAKRRAATRTPINAPLPDRRR